MSIKSALIRFARKIVESVQSQLMQQLDKLQDEVYNPVQAVVKAVIGDTWIGEGADAFAAEVASELIPGVNLISEHISDLHKNIQSAVDIIDRADEQVHTAVNGLTDLFDSIYN